jgi:hypothetical protein
LLQVGVVILVLVSEWVIKVVAFSSVPTGLLACTLMLVGLRVRRAGTAVDDVAR